MLLITDWELPSRTVSTPRVQTVGLSVLARVCVCLCVWYLCLDVPIGRTDRRTHRGTGTDYGSARSCRALNKLVVNFNVVARLLQGNGNHRPASLCSRKLFPFSCCLHAHMLSDKLLNMLVSAFRVGRTCLKCCLNLHTVLNNFGMKSTFHVSSSWRYSGATGIQRKQGSYAMQTFSRADAISAISRPEQVDQLFSVCWSLTRSLWKSTQIECIMMTALYGSFICDYSADFNEVVCTLKLVCRV